MCLREEYAAGPLQNTSPNTRTRHQPHAQHMHNQRGPAAAQKSNLEPYPTLRLAAAASKQRSTADYAQEGRLFSQ